MNDAYLPDIHRLLPQSADAEQGVLGSLLLSPRDVLIICGERGLTHEHFHIPAHADIFRVCNGFADKHRALDVITLTEELRAQKLLDQCGGPAFITDLFTSLPTAANASFYIEILEDKHRLREMIRAATECTARAYEADADGNDLLATLADTLARIAGASQRGTTKSLKTLLQEKIARMEDGEPDADRIPTGISKLDQESPLRLGDMPLISGERKAGKSILALSIARNVVLEDVPTLYFSLEDRTAKVIDRLFAAESQIPMANHHAASMKEGDFTKATHAVNRLAAKQLFIRDDVYDLTAIVAVSRQMKAKHPTMALIVVDYAQLVRVRLAKGSNREQEVAAISRALRMLSMELNVAVVVLCQLNKEGETRESKALEQDCTAMWKVVVPDAKCEGYEKGDENCKRLILIPFQRNGDSGIAFPVSFRGHIARIDNLSNQ